ncbi:hypothetical protein ABZV81_25695 [Streptomyces parvus]|uniref:Uncharacterized protein n=1 Tax=Streptomyces sp. JL1001 TaxID=3078227 RepID=A0AAU8KSH2_9ACTN|nr:hypothetical protein [Streptomyces sp. Termitarium-T10T-6]SCE42400.1 hypothetical protein GA0115253_1051910 [Streptomyces sp. Termitarium-T10T-6]
MSDEDGFGPDAQPLTHGAQSVLSAMVAMLSMRDDMPLVAGLNERLALMEGSPEVEPGERDASVPSAPAPPGESV